MKNTIEVIDVMTQKMLAHGLTEQENAKKRARRRKRFRNIDLEHNKSAGTKVPATSKKSRI